MDFDISRSIQFQNALKDKINASKFNLVTDKVGAFEIEQLVRVIKDNPGIQKSTNKEANHLILERIDNISDLVSLSKTNTKPSRKTNSKEKPTT
ncbi:unnamed protein product [Adineta ricciae]|uniref:Uncharacterized protein n=1 Tax=Adineta ricciae TaxID=249248 RepID=A0A815M0U2_ADIRI|nr:unnamed protein product [Adineta ricciae]